MYSKASLTGCLRQTKEDTQEMKKLLGSLFVLALLSNSGLANAELFKNLKVGGAFDFQANSARNTRDFETWKQDRVGDALTRVLVDTSWDLLDDMHANVTLRKNDRSWGTTGNGGQGVDGNQTVGTAGADIMGTVNVQQAYLKVDKMIGSFDATLGRQYYGEPGDLIIYFGPRNTYGLWANSIDAFRLDWANDTLGVTGLAAKTDGGSAVGTVAGTENDIQGIDVGVKNLPVKLNSYIYRSITHRRAAAYGDIDPNNYAWVYGIKAKGEAMGGWLSAQFAMNSGTNRTATVTRGGAAVTSPANYTGKALLLDAGYKADISNVGAFTPWLTFGAGTGRMSNYENRDQGFMAIESDFRPGIINGRFNNAAIACMDFTTNAGATSVSTLGLNNRVVMGFGLKATPAMAEKLVAGLSFWNYRFQTATDGDTNFQDRNGNWAKRKNIGSEVGLTLDWKHSENVTYGLGYAHFAPGGYIANINDKNNRGLQPAKLAFADLTLKF